MTKPTRPPRRPDADYDSHWKTFIEENFESVLSSGIPFLHPRVDFTKGIEFLQETLQKIYASNEMTGKRSTDVLAKVFLKPELRAENEPPEVWILIHIEVEISPSNDFSLRMFTYYYRALETVLKPRQSKMYSKRRILWC